MTGELLVALIGLAGTLIGALGYTYKRNADVRYARATADARQREMKTKADAEAQVKQLEIDLKDAEIRAAAAKAQEEQIKQVMALLEKQLQINQEHTRQAEAWGDILRQKEKTDERNYQVLKKLGDDNTHYLSEQIVDGNKTLAAAIHEVPAKIELLNVDAVRIMAREIGQQVASEVAGQIVRLLAEWRAEAKENREPSLSAAIEVGP